MRRYLPLFLISFFLIAVTVFASTFLSGYARNPRPEDRKSITVYTSLPVEQVAVLAEEYEKKAGIPVKIIPLNPQDLLTRLKVEAASPQASLILTSSAVLEQAKKDDDLQSYASEQTDLVADRFKDNDNFWTGVWYDPIVFAANADYLKKLPKPPKKWTDLYQSPAPRLGMTDFLAADASANLLYTMIAAVGETQAMTYLAKIHPQIVQYAKFLVTPIRMAGMGECDVAIAVNSEAVRYVNDGFPIKIIYPEEGTAYLVTGAALVKNGTEQSEAGHFLDWLISDHAQYTLQRSHYYFIPTSSELNSYKDYSPKDLKLLDYEKAVPLADQQKFLDQWVHQVRLSPK